jgi:RNA polymerase sigma-70 factor (ECF subfamily)
MLRVLPTGGEPEDEEGARTEALMERVRRGDEAALETLLELYWGRLVRYARSILGSEDAAEDIVQEAFVRLWKGARNWKTGVPAAGFLYLTVRNRCLNEERHRRVRSRLAILRFIPRPDRPATPFEALQDREMSSAVTRALDRLPPRRREVFDLARNHGLSYREIAEVMGISPQTVANQMSAALDHLRRELRPHLESRELRPHLESKK